MKVLTKEQKTTLMLKARNLAAIRGESKEDYNKSKKELKNN